MQTEEKSTNINLSQLPPNSLFHHKTSKHQHEISKSMDSFKTKNLYQKEYNQFVKWKQENNVDLFFLNSIKSETQI